ncbi:PEP-CTERM sorting domain-containing protein [Methylophilus sp.]|jgi:ABC-type Co2+ transport system permease subunit|uniref:PEP-CTERM sorting domain-containing protein n=1 Tax=Methylophilus sp. TaxID=29541 RepID=UPI0011D40E6A|nr:PEP-CTERM sorting domain-containing protein [Methylophilus sp.]TXI47190.1 MAG: PEP-CTERM sorting domain-containing protein [Methylophilus sp.]
MLKKMIPLAGLLAAFSAQATDITVAVPEPESVSLVLVGLGLIGWIVIRRK